MPVRDAYPISLSLESRMIRDPLVVAPDTTVADAIAQMIEARCDSTAVSTPAQNGSSRNGSSKNNTSIVPSVRAPYERANCVVVVENNCVLGLVTEQDILRLVAQGKALDTLTVSQSMVAPATTLPESELASWSKKHPDITHSDATHLSDEPINAIAHLLQQQQTSCFPVVDESDRLVGLVTREDLQCLLNSLVLAQSTSQQIDQLKAKVAQLSAEKIALIDQQTVGLEERVAERTATIQAKAERETLLASVADQVRSSLDTQQVLDHAVREVRSLLECDRVIIYELHGDLSGTVVAESIIETGRSVLHSEVHDPCVSPEWIEPYRQGRVRVVNDVYAEAFTLCHQEMLLGFEIWAKLMTPIVVEETLWGLMIASYGDHPHPWTADEIDLVQQISVQMAIALKHAVTHQQLQTELEIRNQTERELERSETHQRALISALPDLMMRVNREGICLEFVPSSNINILGNSKTFVGNHVSKDLPPEAAQKRLEAIQRALHTQEIQIYEHDLSTDNRVQIEEVRVVPYKEHEAMLLVRDISDRKQAELALRQSEAQSRAILAAIPDLMFCLGADGVYRRIVRPSQDVDFFAHDFTPVGQSMADLLPADITERHLYHVEQAIHTGELQIYEQQIQMGDRLQDEEVRVIKSGDDEVLFMIRDITDRKQAEAALKQSEQTNRTIVETLPDLLIQMNREGRYSRMLGGSTVHIKYPSEVSPEPEVYSVMSQELAEQRLYYTNQAIETGQVQLYEQIFDDADDLRHEEVRIAPLDGDEVLVIVRDVTDRKQAEQQIHQLNLELEAKVEERTAELRERETRYRALVEVIPDLMIRLRIDGTYLDVVTGEGVKMLNPAATRKGGKIYDALPFEQAQQRMFYAQRALHTRDVQFYEYLLAVEGDLRAEETRVIALNDEEVLVIVRDITERKRAETRIHSLLHQTQLLNHISSEIRESLDLNIILQNLVNAISSELSTDICLFAWHRELKSSAILEVVTEQKATHLPSWLGVYPSDTFPNLSKHILDNQIYQVNSLDSLAESTFKTFLKNMGIAAYLCLPIHTLSGKIGSLQIGRISQSKAWEKEELELLRGIGNQVAIAIYQAQLYKESQAKTKKLKRSYQELKDAQLQLIQAEKMSSLGQLVAGIAHEINNPVNFVYGNLSIALDYADSLTRLIQLYRDSEPEPSQTIADFIHETDIEYILNDFPKLLKSMEKGAIRIRDIVRSLRTFSRLDQADCKATDIHSNIEDTLIILQNRLNGRAGNPAVEVIRNYGALPPVECYASLLNQVFMNLLVNAIDAIEESQEEAQTERAGCITITTKPVSDSKVSISIQDNGTGMSPETQARIFNPFFTTKPIGLGTGMGLSISYQIVTGNHQGKFSCHSTPGEGTEFVVELWKSIPCTNSEGE